MLLGFAGLVLVFQGGLGLGDGASTGLAVLFTAVEPSAIHHLPDARITETLHENNNAALMRRYVSAYVKPIRSVIEY